MSSMTLLKAIGNIDDKFIEESMSPTSYHNKKKSIIYISSFTAAAAVMAVVVFSTGILNNITPQPEDEVVTVANPMIQCADMTEAENLAGFTLDAPDSIMGSDSKDLYVYNIDNKLIEITYYLNNEELCTVRKGVGNEDVSGDYNQYESTTQIENNDITYTLNTNSNLVYLVTWNTDGYSYSFSSVKGIKPEEILNILNSIM